MIQLVTGLHSDAVLFVPSLCLRKRIDVFRWEVLQGGDFTWILSGEGKVKSAFATTFLPSHQTDLPPKAIVNVGTAGNADKTVSAGALFHIDKINDGSNGHTFWHDLLVQDIFRESELTGDCLI